MKKALFLAVCLLSFFGAKAQLDDLIIVEYVDDNGGSGYYVKICNPTPNSINLSNYYVKLYQDGNTNPSITRQLSGVIASGNCIIAGNTLDQHNSSNCSNVTHHFNGQGINDNDALALTFGNSNNWVDMINCVGEDDMPNINGNTSPFHLRKVIRDPTNCYRYTNTTGIGPNSWPRNTTQVVTNWTVATAGCISSLNFTFTQPTKNQNITICQGDSVQINGSWRKSSGTFQTTVSSPTGCDTLKNIVLTVLSSSQASVNEQLCAGETFSLHGKTYTTTGTYKDTIAKLSNGCDSIITINITAKPYIIEPFTATICANESYFFDNKNISLAGTYDDTIQIPNSCDSISRLTLIINPLPIKNVNVSLCFGESYNYNGILLSTTGTYRDTIAYAGKCDTIEQLNLFVKAKVETKTNASICENETYFAGGNFQNSSGIYLDTYITSEGCDSLVETTLTVEPYKTKNESYTVCRNGNSMIRGVQVKGDTTFMDTVSSVVSCDTVITITVNEVSTNVAFLFETKGLMASFFDQSINPFQHQWFFDGLGQSSSANPNFEFPEAGIYPVKLIVNTSEGCKDSTIQDVLVYDLPDPVLFIPNAFTPNGDGVNDNFIVKHTEYFPFLIQIFNRWGELIYESSNLDFKWDGSYNGETVPSGSYYYIITGTYQREGALTVIK